MNELNRYRKNICVNGINTHYLDINSNNPNTIILLHSFLADKYVFLNHINLLKDKYHLIVPDLPGFGESEKLRTYNIYTYSEWINGFVAQLNLTLYKTQVWGISLGGVIALHLKNISYFNRVILESTPLSPDNIHTNEFQYISMLSRIPAKRLRKLKNNKFIQYLILILYLLLKPKAKREMPKDLILRYIEKSNVNTLLKVSKLILNPDFYYTTRDMNIFKRNTNILTIYDQADPTIWLKDVKKELPINRRDILQTRIGTHVPSLHNTQSVLKRLDII